MNIIELLKEVVLAQPDKIALVHGKEKVSFGELEQKSQSLATYFKDKGLEKGERALLFIPLSLDLYSIFLALVRIGITVIFIDLSANKKHLKEYCSLAKPDIFIGSPKAHLLRLLKPVRNIKRKFATSLWLPNSKRINYPDPKDTKIFDIATANNDPALITFTSGSSGLPKGICRTHGFLINQHRAISNSLLFEQGDIELSTLPVFILSNLASGITTVIPNCDLRNPANVNAKHIIQDIKKHNVNRILASPAFCKQINNHLLKKNQCLENIDKLYTSGGPVFPNFLSQLANTMPNANIVAVYGSTEAEPIAHIGMKEISKKDYADMQSGKGLLAGELVPEIELAIIPDNYGNPISPLSQTEFEALRLPPNASGEIVVTGNHVQKSYIGKDSQGIKFKVGNKVWHRTGDAGYLDEIGRLWLLGRCSAKVKSTSKKGASKVIYPFSIETAAMSYSEVNRAAFVEVNGQSILAIEPKNNQESKALQQKIPQGLRQELVSELTGVNLVITVKKIPVDKRHNSKVLYHNLKEILRRCLPYVALLAVKIN